MQERASELWDCDDVCDQSIESVESVAVSKPAASKLMLVDVPSIVAANGASSVRRKRYKAFFKHLKPSMLFLVLLVITRFIMIFAIIILLVILRYSINSNMRSFYGACFNMLKIYENFFGASSNFYD